MSSPGQSSPIDWARVERWTTHIVAGEAAEILAAFPPRSQPGFTWNPDPQSLVSDKLRFLRSYWASLRRGAAIPHYRAIDPLNMGPILGYVLLLEPTDGDRDFRYRLFGSSIASVSGFDLTGKLASEMAASSPVVEFGLASYRAVVRRKEPLHTVRAPVGAYRTARWHRLTLPLADDGGRLVRLIAVSLPIGRHGKLVE